MRVFKLDSAANAVRASDVKSNLEGRTIVKCGVAEFQPHTVAHQGEPHVHEADEVFVVLRGEMTVPVAGGEAAVLSTGDWVLVEAGEEHHVTNESDTPAVVIYVIFES